MTFSHITKKMKGIKLTVYASSAETSDNFPPRIKLLPLGPRAAVIRRPKRMNVKMSPCYRWTGIRTDDMNQQRKQANLSSILRKKVHRVITILNCRTDIRKPVENEGGCAGILGYDLQKNWDGQLVHSSFNLPIAGAHLERLQWRAS